LGKIWKKVFKIVANLIRFGQNQNLASSKTFDLLRLWRKALKSEKQSISDGYVSNLYVTHFTNKSNFG